MATRKIIDVEQNGEKVWLKGHAQAIYMSDGSTVEDAINSIEIPSLDDYATNLKTINNESLVGDGNIVVGNIISEEDDSLTIDDVDTNTYVKYVAQTLTEEQKAQVRTNINALSQNNIKTINGKSIIGSGDLTIEGGAKVYNVDLNTALETRAVTQDVYDAIIAADVVHYDGILLDKMVYDGTIQLCCTLFYISDDDNSLEPQSIECVIGADLSVTGKMGIAIIPTKNSQLENDSNFISSDNLKTINGESIIGSGNIEIEDSIYNWEWDGSESGTITQDQWDALQRADNLLIKDSFNNIYPSHTFNKTTDTILIQLITSLGLSLWNLINISINSDLSYQIYSRNATYIKSGGLKTINGESLEGSGDITISGAYPEIDGSIYKNESTAGEAYAPGDLLPNTFYVFPECTWLAIHGFIETSGVTNEYIFQFSSGSEPTTLSLPNDIKWTGGETPTFEANKIYQVSILKGLGSVLSWSK